VSNQDLARRRLAAVCGRLCEFCDGYLDGPCRGCGYQLGETRRGECALFKCCVEQRGLEHCGLCSDFPCQLFVNHATPLAAVRRYRALLRRAEIGTVAWLDEQQSQDQARGSV
jgi:hypothetical protein